MIYDLIIVGLGVAGMNAALYAKRSGLKMLVFESEVPGGLLNKTNKIENFPGYVSISGPDLASNLFIQFNALGIPVKYECVENLYLENDIKVIKTKKGEYRAKSVIIASGRKPKRLGAKGEDELIGKGVSYCHLCDGNLYKDKITAVIGGGNSAVSGALYLSDICEKVYLIVRKNYLVADKMYQDELEKKNNIEVLYETTLNEIVEKEGIVNKIILNNGELDVNGIFINIGYVPQNSFYENLEICNEKGFVQVNKNMETIIPGIFAAGDIIEKDVYQIITAQSEGAVAAVSAYNYLNYKK